MQILRHIQRDNSHNAKLFNRPQSILKRLLEWHWPQRERKRDKTTSHNSSTTNKVWRIVSWSWGEALLWRSASQTFFWRIKIKFIALQNRFLLSYVGCVLFLTQKLAGLRGEPVFKVTEILVAVKHVAVKKREIHPAWLMWRSDWKIVQVIITNWTIKPLTLAAGHLQCISYIISSFIHSSRAHQNRRMTSSQLQWLHSLVG